MKKNKDGSFTLKKEDLGIGSLKCEVPAYLITKYEFYLLSRSDSSSLLKIADVFLKMLLGFLLQFVTSLLLLYFDEELAKHRMDAFQYLSMLICLLVYILCRGIAKFKGTERIRLINKIDATFK